MDETAQNSFVDFMKDMAVFRGTQHHKAGEQIPLNKRDGSNTTPALQAGLDRHPIRIIEGAGVTGSSLHFIHLLVIVRGGVYKV